MPSPTKRTRREKDTEVPPTTAPDTPESSLMELLGRLGTDINSSESAMTFLRDLVEQFELDLAQLQQGGLSLSLS